LIAYGYRAQGQFDQAREHLARELAVNPKHVESLANLGYLDLGQGSYAEAQKHLEEALALDPDNIAANFDLARVWIKQRQTDRALEALLHVVNLSPDHAQAHYQLFLLYSRTKQSEAAQKELTKFKEMEELDKALQREQTRIEKTRRFRMTGSTEEIAEPAARGQSRPPAPVAPPPPGASKP
jgi:tetratricopeptide (TPR) repeat protein